jgi:hypothetical protein
MRQSLSRVLASYKKRLIKPTELPPKIDHWKILRGDKVGPLLPSRISDMPRRP